MTARAPVWWPAPLPDAADGVFVIGVRGDGQRDGARAAVRHALRAALAGLAGLAPAAVHIDSGNGQAPRVRFGGATALAPPGIAISHDGPLSLAAIHLHGPVGIDLQAIADVPEWALLARDYLGPAALRQLQAAPATARPALLAALWTDREARLKCLGLALTEWQPGCPADALTGTPLALPAGYAGSLALPARAA